MIPREWIAAYIRFLITHRVAVSVAVALLTSFFAYKFLSLRIFTNFFDLYPSRHPYIQLYTEYRRMFGTANVLLMVVERKDGDIYNVETIGKVNRLTIGLLETAGVNPYQLLSLTHPNMRDIRVAGSGITSYPVMYPGPPKTATDIARIKRAVYTNEGIYRFYVSENHKAALITAGFWEEGVDLGKLYDRIMTFKAQEEDANHTIYVTGYPMLYAWVFQYTPLILQVLGVTVLVMVGLLWFYFRTFTGTMIPLFSGTLSGIWGLGFAGLFGFHLDPLVLVVPVLISARALSHSVQSMERYHEEYFRLRDKEAAIFSSYTSLFTPAMISILTDGPAILAIAVTSIPVMSKMAYITCFWIISVFISVVTLHPVILSFLRPPKVDPKAGQRLSDKIYDGICQALTRLCVGRKPLVVVACFLVFLVVGVYYSHQLKVGDVSLGRALFYPTHPYNVGYDKVNEQFVGASQLVIIAEGKQPGAIKDPQALKTLEAFQKYMEKQETVGGSITVANMVRQLYRLFQEGIPKWEILPDDARDVGNMLYQILATVGADTLDRFIDKDSRNATITIFYKDYTHDIIQDSLARAQEFMHEHPLEGMDFRLAGGLIGVLAAINEEVEWASRVILYLVLGVVFILSYLTYRSVVMVLIVMIPSIVAQPLSEAFMYWWGIDLNINSLPIAAVGIGIGVDYGYYVLSRILEEYEECRDFVVASQRCLLTTGKAVMFTGSTLVASVVFWILFPMRFQAEMGLLLAMILVLHVVGALIFIPAVVSLVKPRYAIAQAEKKAIEAAG